MINFFLPTIFLSFLFSLSVHRCPEIPTRDERPDLETYYQSPSGYFYVHYDTSGEDAPDQMDVDGNGIPDYVEQVAHAADSSKYILVDVMGFIEENKDPDEIYDIYIRDLSSNLWGSTQYEAGGSSFIKIRKNYEGMSNYCSDSNELLWLTVAHEFFHAIQYAYRPNSSDSYIREMSSMWFENVFVENCYDFLAFTDMGSNSLFNNPEEDFDSNITASYGYSLALYGHYLSTVVDPDGVEADNQLSTTIIRRFWESYSLTGDVQNSIEYILEEYYDTKFYTTWADFMSRNMFAGNPENNYPPLQMDHYHPGLELIDAPAVTHTQIKGDSETFTESITTGNTNVFILAYEVQDNLSIDNLLVLDAIDDQHAFWYGEIDSTIGRISVSSSSFRSSPLKANDKIFYVFSSEIAQNFQLTLEVNDAQEYGCIDYYADNYNEYADTDDGSCNYSSSRKALFPNPVNLSAGPLYLDYIDKEQHNLSCMVLDIKGRIVYEKSLIDVSMGRNVIEFSDLGNIPSGIYFFLVDGELISQFTNVK